LGQHGVNKNVMKSRKNNKNVATSDLSELAGSAPEVLESSARKWDDNGNRECCAFLLESGEWVLTWLRGSGEDKVQTTVKLSPTAALATMSAMSSVSQKTGKPLGWEPKQNVEMDNGE